MSNNNKSKQNNKGQGNRAMSKSEALKAIVMLCLYLSGWEEDSRKNPGEKIFRAWKGYVFQILNDLTSDGLIIQNSRYKTVLVTKKGLELGQNLKEQVYQLLGVQADA
jgi:hypothetical protein